MNGKDAALELLEKEIKALVTKNSKIILADDKNRILIYASQAKEKSVDLEFFRYYVNTGLPDQRTAYDRKKGYNFRIIEEIIEKLKSMIAILQTG